MAQKVILAGGSGFVGTALTRRLAAEGWEVVVLSRSPAECHVIRDTVGTVRAVGWDGRTAGAWAREVDGAAAVVNLAGRSVNCVHTPENRQQILESRLDAVRALAAALGAARRPPAVWVQASAVGYYGPRGADPCPEDAPPGGDFLASVCRRWEEAQVAGCPAAVRPVILRLGMVLGNSGGAFPLLARLARWGLGGAAGSGRQGMSWIHLDDVVALVVRALGDETMREVYNATAPEPVANAAFMRALRTAVRRPWSPPAPAFAIALAGRYLLGTDPSLVLDGQFAPPARLVAAGHAFRFPTLASALADLVTAGRK